MVFVIELGISSRFFPKAILAAILAIGYPVALDARAELRETLGFTSITMYSMVSGSRANCMLHPPSTPNARIILSDACFRVWLTWSDSVWAGATTMLSPVCMPIGSRFSMLQMVMQLLAVSLITSYSISIHPAMDFSINTWFIMESCSPWVVTFSTSSLFNAIPPPPPPRV